MTAAKKLDDKKPRELWKLEDLAAYLRIPRTSAHLLVAKGDIPCIRLGKHMRFIPDDVEAAIKRLTK